MQQKPPPVAQINPPEIRDALVRAGMDRDHARIDALTDNLAVRKFARPRHDDSRFAEWAAISSGVRA